MKNLVFEPPNFLTILYLGIFTFYYIELIYILIKMISESTTV